MFRLRQYLKTIPRLMLPPQRKTALCPMCWLRRSGQTPAISYRPMSLGEYSVVRLFL